jgi:hypothetical protein
MTITCPGCGGTLSSSSFDACLCSVEGRAWIEGRSLEERSHECLKCGGGLMFAGQLCPCGRARPGESKRRRPMPWETATLDGAEALRQLERRFAMPG